MSDDPELFENQVIGLTAATAELRGRVLQAVANELQIQSAKRAAWRRVLSMAALLLVSIAMNLWCGAHDREFLSRTFGGERHSSTVRMLQEDVQRVVPGASTDWVEDYIYRFGEI